MNNGDPIPSMTEETANLVTAAADLGRRNAERAPMAYDLTSETSLTVSRLHRDERIEITDLEGHLLSPNRPRGTATLHDADDFVQYVQRLAQPDYTTVWAQLDTGTVTAVFDDHADSATAGWRSHTAQLRLQPDPDWQAWLGLDRKMLGQLTLAEHFEDLAHTVIDPDAATMLELAQTFNAKRNVNFRSGARVDNGDVQLTYEETTQANAGRAGQMEIPSAFTVRLSPFRGTAPADISARLRWRITEGQLTIGYALLRPDRVRDDILAALVGSIRDLLDLPVLLGPPPQRVTPL